jgi:hypothetical protein
MMVTSLSTTFPMLKKCNAMFMSYMNSMMSADVAAAMAHLTEEPDDLVTRLHFCNIAPVQWREKRGEMRAD